MSIHPLDYNLKIVLNACGAGAVYLVLRFNSFFCCFCLCVLKEKAIKFLQKMAEQLQLPHKIFRVCIVQFMFLFLCC